jgi:AraC-like DNA-binding protein
MDESVRHPRKRILVPARPSFGLGPEVVFVGHNLVREESLPGRDYVARNHGLTLLLRGELDLRMDRHAIPPERPLMWLVPAGTVCYERCGSPLESRWAAFRSSALTIRRQGFELELSDGRSALRIPRWKRLDAAAAAGVVELYRRLRDSSERQGLAASAESAALLLELFTRFLELPAVGEQASGHRALRRFRALLEEHAFADRRIADLAREAGGSSDHLGVLFRRRFGARPVDYRNRLRLSRARELLAAGGVKVKDAARAVGFADQLYFSRLFRRRYGLSPREIGRGAGPP